MKFQIKNGGESIDEIVRVIREIESSKIAIAAAQKERKKGIGIKIGYARCNSLQGTFV